MGNLEIVKYLIENGSDLNISNEKNESPLNAACDSNNIEIILYLLEKTKAVNDVSKHESIG
ncbi:MAG: ankyrin repeat domain-containing protein [Alphaproteobacteria bacterium]